MRVCMRVGVCVGVWVGGWVGLSAGRDGAGRGGCEFGCAFECACARVLVCFLWVIPFFGICTGRMIMVNHVFPFFFLGGGVDFDTHVYVCIHKYRVIVWWNRKNLEEGIL